MVPLSPVRFFSVVASLVLAGCPWVMAGPKSSGASRSSQSAAQSRIVVAIRYLQKEGVSHSHLYLFRRDGELVRQLTRDNSGQDHDPVFSPDGTEIVYQRTVKKEEQWRAVRVDGGQDRAFPHAPDWYKRQAAPPSAFDYREKDKGDASDAPEDPSAGVEIPGGDENSTTYGFRDGSFRLIREFDPGKERGTQSWIQAADGGKRVSVDTLPVFCPARPRGVKDFWAGPLPPGPVRCEQREVEDLSLGGAPVSGRWLSWRGTPLLGSGEMRAAFFFQHMGSTDGNQVLVLDFKTRRIFEMSPNGATVFVMQGRSEFACICEQRYLRLGDGGTTVNCSYLDLWDAKLQRVRFGAQRPAVFYGAALHFPGARIPGFHLPRQ